MQENNNVYFLYNNVALLYNNAPKQDQDRKKRTFLRKNQGYHPVLEFYSKWLDKQILLKKKCFYHSFKFISRYGRMKEMTLHFGFIQIQGCYVITLNIFRHLMTLSQSHYGTMKNLDALPWEDALKWKESIGKVASKYSSWTLTLCSSYAGKKS